MIKKFFKAVIGIGLYPLYVKKFKLNFLSDKRIALVGPADSALNTNLGEIIDEYDLVVRINKAPYQLKKGIHKGDIGSKLDILFHSFLENERTGGGKLDFDLYRELGVKYVVNPIPTYFGKRKVYNFFKKYLSKQKVYITENDPYESNIQNFGSFRPTTGFSGLNFILNSNFKQLHITGFTFFKTAYGDGYRDHFKDMKANERHIKSENAHDPDTEFNEFVKLLQKYPDKQITTDQKLHSILKSECDINIPVLERKN